jgi:hypothetical protein
VFVEETVITLAEKMAENEKPAKFNRKKKTAGQRRKAQKEARLRQRIKS